MINAGETLAKEVTFLYMIYFLENNKNKKYFTY